MSERETKILNITSGILGIAIALCIILGVFSFITQRAPKLKPTAYEAQQTIEMTGTEPVEVTQNYQSFSVSAADAS